jgi:hypothetical protein
MALIDIDAGQAAELELARRKAALDVAVRALPHAASDDIVASATKFYTFLSGNASGETN